MKDFVSILIEIAILEIGFYSIKLLKIPTNISLNNLLIILHPKVLLMKAMHF
jgi:hypothetical protein